MEETITLEQALDIISEEQTTIIQTNTKLIDTIIQDQNTLVINHIEQDIHTQADDLLNEIEDGSYA